jgi:hypothetical protein
VSNILVKPGAVGARAASESDSGFINMMKILTAPAPHFTNPYLLDLSANLQIKKNLD